MNGTSKSATPPLRPSHHLVANHPSLQYSFLSHEDTASLLRTDLKTGLSDHQDYLHRRSIHGLNQLQDDTTEPLYIKFLNQFKESPLILLLLASAAASVLMGNVDDAISITLVSSYWKFCWLKAIVIVLTGILHLMFLWPLCLVGFVQEYRSEKSLEALNKLVPHHAHLVRYGKLSCIVATQLVPGDLVRFSVGDRIPADIRLTEVLALHKVRYW
jgi:P-type Ca2+ transporter type 2C